MLFVCLLLNVGAGLIKCCLLLSVGAGLSVVCLFILLFSCNFL